MGKITEGLKELTGSKSRNRTDLTSAIDPHIITYYSPKAPVAEQYRSLRTNIQSLNPDNPPRTFVISSSIHGEGKSTTAVNLAVAMAQDMDKTILLGDCDLRKPAVGRLLGLKPRFGLVEVLNEEIELKQALLPTAIDNLVALPCGRIPPNPSELLGSKKMSNLLVELRSYFDYVILDAPPIIPLTDAGVLGAQTDGVLLIIQAYRTQREMVQRTYSLLARARSTVLGFVLTNMRDFLPKYFSEYGYHYGYHYSYQYDYEKGRK